MYTMAMQCPICGLVLLILKLYVSHLRLVHAKDPNFNLMCGVGGCREVFRAFSAFNSHIYRHHREAIGIDSATEQHLESSTSTVPPVSEYESESVAAVVCDPLAVGSAPVNVEVVRRDMKEVAARFYSVSGRVATYLKQQLAMLSVDVKTYASVPSQT